MIRVSHQDAEAYCAWLSETTAAGYRLPTEAEWEYACRARDRSIYAFGDGLSHEQANFEKRIGKTTEVGAYPTNGWNLHDMHGDVWELCADASRAYTKSAVTDPKDEGSLRVGSWLSLVLDLRSAGRYADGPDYLTVTALASAVLEFRGRQARP